MIRRTVLTAAAVLSLTLVPAAAMAYDAPGYSTTVSDSSPAAGKAVSVTIKGAKAGEKVTLTITSTASLSKESIQIAGAKSMTKSADASGAASFSVTFAAGGAFDLVATDSNNAVLSSQSLTVAVPAGSSASASAGTAAGTKAATLSDTGFDGMELAAGAGALVLAGAGAVVVARRRQTAGA